ncbi:hypothetical protein QUB13_04975 [Microcoleus sp. B4-D4]
MAVGCWLLAVGCWLLAVSARPLSWQSGSALVRRAARVKSLAALPRKGKGTKEEGKKNPLAIDK